MFISSKVIDAFAISILPVVLKIVKQDQPYQSLWIVLNHQILSHFLPNLDRAGFLHLSELT